jgi:uncharacterized caspase-like protein
MAAAVLALAALNAVVGKSFADTRVALVIGNGAYEHIPRLRNPQNDAEDVAAALKRSGFDTILATNLDKAGMDNAAIRFARAARGADVALLYYSGHKRREGTRDANQTLATSRPVGVSDLGDREWSARILERNLARGLEALLLFHG